MLRLKKTLGLSERCWRLLIPRFIKVGVWINTALKSVIIFVNKINDRKDRFTYAFNLKERQMKMVATTVMTTKKGTARA
jgi:hypothetical protein